MDAECGFMTPDIFSFWYSILHSAVHFGMNNDKSIHQLVLKWLYSMDHACSPPPFDCFVNDALFHVSLRRQHSPIAASVHHDRQLAADNNAPVTVANVW